MGKIIEKLNIYGKVSEVHAQEIEEIIQGLITKSFDTGFRSGRLKFKKEILEKIEKWLWENHEHHESDKCIDSNKPYVNSVDLEKFIKKL